MIFLLGDPVKLLGVAIGLLVGVVLHNLAQSLAARATGDRAARMASRMTFDPRRHLEPFGVIAMAVAGLGWGRPVELTEPGRRVGSRGRYLATLLAGPAATLVLGSVLLVVAVTASGERNLLDIDPAHALWEVLLWAGLVNVQMAVLQLVPLPPLDGARIMWALAPPTAGWQKARYNLEEQNYGLGALLILMLPIFGGVGLIIRIVNAVAAPLIESILGLSI